MSLPELQEVFTNRLGLILVWLKQDSDWTELKPGRLKPELLSVHIQGKGIHAVCDQTVEQAAAFFDSLVLSDHDQMIAEQAVADMQAKLRFLLDVGLGYLSLSRSADSLSGGESQRIRLATQLGARLTGTIYVLDEPTIGLHQ